MRDVTAHTVRASCETNVHERCGVRQVYLSTLTEFPAFLIPFLMMSLGSKGRPAKQCASQGAFSAAAAAADQISQAEEPSPVFKDF